MEFSADVKNEKENYIYWCGMISKILQVSEKSQVLASLM